MPFINFSPTASNSTQNALAMGLQLGQQAAEGANRRGFNNALANFDPSNPDSIREVTRFNPQVGLQLQQQAQQQQQAAVEQQRQQMMTLRRLLDKAGEGPEGYAQAIGAARQLGIDVSRVPQQFNPEWVAQQKFIFDAIESPQGQAVLSTAGKQAADEGLQPGTPPFQARVRELVNAGLNQIVSVDAGGTIAGVNRATGESRIIASPGGSQPTQPAVRVQTIQEAQSLPPGTRFIDPNGVERIVPGGASGNASGGF